MKSLNGLTARGAALIASSNLTSQNSDETISIKKDISRRRSMKLTTKGQYAIVALTFIKNHSNGSPVRLTEIAKGEKLSINYLEQLFRKLRVAGIVQSIRGPGGGYVLSTEPLTVGAKTTYPDKEINYLQVLEAVGERLSFSDNLSRDTAATQTTIEKLDMVNDMVKTQFEAMTI